MIRDKITNEQIIDVLIKHLGFLSYSARSLGISRATLYRWINDDQELQEVLSDCREGMIDFVEGELLKKIKKGDTTAIIFYLKTQGKSRGYTERHEHIEHVEQPLFLDDDDFDGYNFDDDNFDGTFN